MKGTMKKMQISCQNFSHIAKNLATISFFVSICTAGSSLFADELCFSQLNHNKAIKHRGPSSFVPNEEIEVVPPKNEVWLQKVLVDDDAGVLRSIRNNLNQWQATEDYARAWNLQSTGLYTIKTTQDKKSYLNRKMLKYLDKRLSGEIKHSEEGSTLRRVANVQKALKPKVAVAVSSNVKVKFKARLLQGKAFVVVDNPYVDYKTELTAKGDINMKLEKRFDKVGVSTHMDYDIKNGTWLTYVDKKVIKAVTARVSSSQSEKEMAFTENANKTVQLFFSKPF